MRQGWLQKLTTKKPHFVFELIQNAEDNTYQNGITPRIRFVVNEGELLVQNNELGFKEDDVVALCGVGSSTKKNKNLGYIGEKGIGFKSVFMVTDTPQLFSKGFQFGYEFKKENPKSILIPQWIEKLPKGVNRKETNIILPIKDELKTDVERYVAQITPSLMLFLRKLRIIEIENKITKKNQRIRRIDYDGYLEIKQGSKNSCWKTIRKTIQVPDDIHEERRKDVLESVIMLAFPLKNKGLAITSEEQSVFAFLPIRKYGLKFIIHADFVLPVGREDILKENAWNEWLRNSIASLFLEAIEEFKVDENLKYTYYGFIPSEEEVKDDFFSNVVKQLFEGLQETTFLLSESNEWKKPSEILLADKELKKIVPNDFVKNYLKKQYIHDKARVPDFILHKLNIEGFSFDLLVQCLKLGEWIEKQDNEWFALLYQYLSSEKLDDAQIDILKDLQILKLQSGKLTSINEGLVFFPLSNKKEDYGFEVEMRYLSKNVFEIMGKGARQNISSVKSFLTKLGVKQPQTYEIIENYILPIYESERWKHSTSDVLFGHVKYIRDNLAKYEKEARRILDKDKT